MHVNNALLPVFGGPAGRHARPAGPFFQPLPWVIGAATVLFAVVYLRHLPCLTSDPNNPINAYIRLCYSDISAHYSFMHWSGGVKVLGGDQLSYAPLVGLLITFSVWLGQVLEWRFEEPQHDYAGMAGYFGATTILLFACFLVLVICSATIARKDGRDWDALALAASPVVLASGLLSWDLLGLSLTVVAVFQLRGGRYVESGLVLGLAASAASWPLVFVVGAVASLALAARWGELARLFLPLVGILSLVHLPQIIAHPGSVYAYYRGLVNSSVSYGSVPYLFEIAGLTVREWGPLLFALALILTGVFLSWLYVSRRRPSAEDISFVVLLIFALLAPAYPPQTGLWVVVALFLCRRVDVLFWVFSGVQVAHYVAVWARLSGHLTLEKSGPEALYFLAVLVRFAFELVLLALAVQSLSDVRRAGLESPHSDTAADAPREEPVKQA